MKVLADRIQQALEERNWGYRALARKTGLSENFIGMVANDRSNPTAPNVAAIAKALGVSADWLLGLEDRRG